MELLGITKEFHDLLVVLVKRKRQNMEENASRVNSNSFLMNNTEVEDEILNSHYTRPHWARATMETLVRIGNIKEPVLALTDYEDQFDVQGVRPEEKVAYKHQPWMEDLSNYKSQGISICGLSGCDGEDRRCGD